MQIIHNHFNTLTSTSDFAKEHIASFEVDKITLITASSQLKGRGQNDKRWSSPAGLNIYASFCFFINKEEDPFLFTRKMCEMVIHVLEKWGIQGTIKWPNDVLVHQKKIAGILTETTPFPTKTGVIVGVGLNVNMELKELQSVGQQATSMLVELGHHVNLDDVLNELKLKVVHIRDNNK